MWDESYQAELIYFDDDNDDNIVVYQSQKTEIMLEFETESIEDGDERDAG